VSYYDPPLVLPFLSNAELTDGIPTGWQPTGKVYCVAIEPQDDGDTNSIEAYPLSIEVVFAHTPNYPDQAPLFKVRSVRGLSDEAIQRLQNVLEPQIDENLGMSMMYTLILAAQDQINNLAANQSGPSNNPEAQRRKMLEAEEARLAELRVHGTPVTLDTFNEWKLRFDAEMNLEKVNLKPDKLALGQGEKMTGRQWFRQHETAKDEEGETEGRVGYESWSEEEEYVSDWNSNDDDDILDEFLADKQATL
jgi:hypothetical protein